MTDALECVGDHGLDCPCFAEAEHQHGERCLFGTCRAIQRAELNGDRKLAKLISAASGMLFTPDRPTIVGHSGGACCPCTCDVEPSPPMDFDQWLAVYGLHGQPGGDLSS